MFAQEPGANQDFGKYSKQPSFDTNFLASGTFMLALINPIQKLPKDKNWIQFEEESTDLKQIAGITLHPSRTFLGDTTSVSYQGEYIEHHSNPYFSDVAPVCFYSDLVTNKEWNVFRAYVRDSILRKIIASNEGAKGWLINPEVEYEISESDFLIDWKSNKLEWRNEFNDLFQYYYGLTYSESNDYYGNYIVDERKLIYKYYWKDFEACKKQEDSIRKVIPDINKRHVDCGKSWRNESTSLFRDSTLWIKDTSLIHFNNIEDGICQFYNYQSFFENYPVTSINAPQAKAYLKWLEINHQKYLERNELAYTVIYELPKYPLSESHKTEVISSIFKLNNWQVTNIDYEKFVEYVRDSIALRILAAEFDPIQYSVPVLDYELTEKDYSEWNLNWEAKLDWKNKTGKPYNFTGRKITPEHNFLNKMFYNQKQGDTNLIDKRKLVITQYYFDFKTAAIDFDRFPSNMKLGSQICKDKISIAYNNENDDCFRGRTLQNLGKNLNLSNINNECFSSDIYSVNDRAQFIERGLVNVYPNVKYKRTCRNYHYFGDPLYGKDSKDSCLYFDCFTYSQHLDWIDIPNEYDFKSQPKTLIQDITYDQFLAYWRWRIEKGKLPNDNENPVISHYIPSEGEFFKIQAGENIMHQSEIHALPTPSFRYVVKFYPKND